MSSLRAFLDAVSAFVDHLSDVRLAPLAIALGLQLTNLLLRSVAWRTILRAAFPDASLSLRRVIGAYLAGAGVNAVAPARGGDVVKLIAVRRGRGLPVTAVAATLVVETIFDTVIATGLLVWAYSSGRLPHLPDLPSAPAFEWSFVARHETGVGVGLVVAIVALALFGRWLARHVREFRARVGQGLAVLHQPARYLRAVALPQGLGWICRVGVAYELLDAFRITPSFADALVVLVVGSVATLLPFTPGGAGAQQALLVIALARRASSSQLLAYSVGAQLATTALNAVVGITALLVIFRTLRLGRIRGQGRAVSP